MGKFRFCKSCGEALKQNELYLCESCRTADFCTKTEGKIAGEEAVRVILARQKAGIKLLEGMDLDTVAEAARQWGAQGYSTYGRFRAYCDETGRLPPRRGNEKLHL